MFKDKKKINELMVKLHRIEWDLLALEIAEANEEQGKVSKAP